MTVEIEHVLTAEDVREVIETAEQAGSIRASELTELVETARDERARGRGPPPRVRAARHRRRRGQGGAAASAAADRLRDDDRRAPAVPARGGPARAPDRGPGGRALEADRARRPRREAAHDPVQPAPRRLDREELPQPGPAVPRPDPGRDARADPRRREVRLAARLQVLDVRDLVDPPGGRACARRQGAHDPHAGPHRRAAPEDEQGRAPALDAARPRADARRDRRGGQPAASSRRAR